MRMTSPVGVPPPVTVTETAAVGVPSVPAAFVAITR
jgi:hypothetical protein